MKKLSFLPFMLVASMAVAQGDLEPHVEIGKNGTVKAVEFRSNSNTPPGADQFFERFLKTSSRDQFRSVPHKTKNDDLRHEHFDQYYEGVKVEGGGYNF